MSEQRNEGTKLCKYCQSAIPVKAKVCSNCGRKQSKKLKFVIIAVIVFFILAAIAGSSDSDSESKKNGKKVGQIENTDSGKKEGAKDDKEDTSKEPEKNGFDVGDIVETEDLRITFISAGDYISDNQFMQPKEGMKYVSALFEFENISDKNQLATSFDFNCYADGYEAESKYFDTDLSADLSPGRKSQGYVYYEVPVDASEICLEYETNYWTSDKVLFYISR